MGTLSVAIACQWKMFISHGSVRRSLRSSLMIGHSPVKNMLGYKCNLCLWKTKHPSEDLSRSSSVLTVNKVGARSSKEKEILTSYESCSV